MHRFSKTIATNYSKNIFNQLNIDNIFLVDATGAILSALFTGLLLAVLSSNVGLPISFLHKLAMFPILIGCGSLCFHFLVSKKRPWMLLVIVGANLAYCALASAIVISFESLTSLGCALLISEVIVVLVVVFVEFRIYRNTRTKLN